MSDLLKEAIDPKDRSIDLDLWRGWQEGGQNPDDLRPLIQRFRPLVRKRSNQWTGQSDVGIPPAAIHAEFDKWFLHALDTYDPDKGHLGTWVDWNLNKAKRWTVNRRNSARIGEKRVYKDVGTFQRTKSILDDQLGREPTSLEVADYLGWDEKKVNLLDTEIRRTLTTSGWGGSGLDPMSVAPSEDLEKLQLLRYQLSNEELQVFDYLVGWGGKPKLKAIDIASRLGTNPSKITRIKQGIADKLKGYI